MFGYIKPMREEMLVREYELYRALYCGLCRQMKKSVSFLFTPTLSYDFVFLAAFREAVSQSTPEISKMRCIAHPLKKRSYISSDTSLYNTCISALVLIYYKLKDDIKDNDTGLLKGLFDRIYSFYLKGKIKKLAKFDSKISDLCKTAESLFDDISILEKNRTDDPDLPAAAFGKLLAVFASFGLCESDKLIAEELGLAIGKYIYYIDAIDDLKKDYERQAYNPFLERFETPKKVFEHIDSIDMALSCHINSAVCAANLINKCQFSSIISNILEKGLGLEAYRIFERANPHSVPSGKEKSQDD